MYWEAHPPLHILVQGIASGLSGQVIGKLPEEARELGGTGAKDTTVEEMMAIISETGINGY